MQNLEKQVGQIFKILVNTEERQIKCECKIAYMKVEDLEEKMDRKERALQEKLHFNSWIKRRKEQKYR